MTVTLEETWQRYPADALVILQDDDDVRATRCGRRGCQMPIWWGTTARNRKRCPFDIKPDGTRTGTSHWRTRRDRPGRG